MEQKQSCSNCRFWSQMCAYAGGGDPLMALCLADGGPHHGTYTREAHRCDGWKSGHLGNVDDPPDYGETARAAYETEEGPDACRPALSKSTEVNALREQVRAWQSIADRDADRCKELVKALHDIVWFCDDPNGSESPESLACGLARLLPAAREALSKVKS